MSWKAKVPVPAGVEILRRYDRREIDGSTSKLSLFTPTPTQNDPDNNYVNNPLPGAKNHVVLAVSVSPLTLILKDETNVDAIAAANGLYDSVFKLETNGGREERILHPLKDYFNFSSTSASVASAYDGGATAVVNQTIVNFQATGPRNVDNLFYFEPNESFTVDVDFADGSIFPAASDVTNGRFGLEVELYFAQMTNQQLQKYDQRLKQAAG